MSIARRLGLALVAALAVLALAAPSALALDWAIQDQTDGSSLTGTVTVTLKAGTTSTFADTTNKTASINCNTAHQEGTIATSGTANGGTPDGTITAARFVQTPGAGACPSTFAFSPTCVTVVEDLPWNFTIDGDNDKNPTAAALNVHDPHVTITCNTTNCTYSADYITAKITNPGAGNDPLHATINSDHDGQTWVDKTGVENTYNNVLTLTAGGFGCATAGRYEARFDITHDDTAAELVSLK